MDAERAMDAERERLATFGHLEEGLEDAGTWYRWGPYVAERAWGSVREDYSADGDAWSSFPHDHARSRAYRWNEDGMAGISDIHGRLCLALALWNGHDPILKERMFGLANAEGNHGEDAKEYWWYLDALPSSAWLRWRYHYPQAAFPYDTLIRENARRSKEEPEYELVDTGVFDEGRFFVVEVDYAKADPDDVLMRVRVRNAGPEAADVHVLPTLWVRNTWSWGTEVDRPRLWAEDDARILASHPELGDYELLVGPGPESAAKLLFCENETNVARLYGSEPLTPYPKDGINDHVVAGAATVDPGRSGTRAAAWYRFSLAGGETAELRLRLRASSLEPVRDPLGAPFQQTMTQRAAEADTFYAALERPDLEAEERRIMRQAFAGMLWCKQYYAYDVGRWLDGDPGRPPPPASRHHGRNARWRHFDAADILSMPDSWEYPWFAAWDLAFHSVTLAHLDPAFAKYQLLLLCREWFQHPTGALPAYEWTFDDVNPPVHAWAALRVFLIDGATDTVFLERVFRKLLMNYTWWLTQEDTSGTNLFGGGFLGLDNIGAIDRSHLPPGTRLEQSDATAWMAFYTISMLRIAYVLSSRDRSYDDMLVTFLEHAVRIVGAMESSGMWDPDEAFYFDLLYRPDGSSERMRIHSMVGVIPLLPAAFVPESSVLRNIVLGKHVARFLASRGLSRESFERAGSILSRPGTPVRLLSVVSTDRLRRLLEEMLAEDAFLSPYGLRALSARHRDEPFRLHLDGVEAVVDYEPGESRSGLFGGNSNWRGPVWFPLNYLVLESLLHWDDWFGGEATAEYPTGSGEERPLGEIARDLARRLISIWLPDADGRRPVHRSYGRLADDPEWRDLLPFHEYFHGDTGAGLGASHQTGWTGLVADLLARGGLMGTLARLELPKAAEGLAERD
jgi:hypothetical protein